MTPGKQKKKSKRSKGKGNKPKEQAKDRMNWKALGILLALFMVVESLGIATAHTLVAKGIQAQVFGEADSIANAAYLFLSIIVMTSIMLLLIKLRKRRQTLWLIEFLAVFVTSLIIFEAFLGEKIGLFLAIVLVLLRISFHNNIWLRNVAGVVAIAGAGSLLGISLGLVPIIAFISALAIYDRIAVFGTKHMVQLGRAVTKDNFAFTLAIPTKEYKFELGNGDLIIPLLVSSSLIANGPFRHNYIIAFFVLAASYVGIAISIQTVSVKKVPMPALPPQTVLMLAVIGVGFLLGL